MIQHNDPQKIDLFFFGFAFSVLCSTIEPLIDIYVGNTVFEPEPQLRVFVLQVNEFIHITHNSVLMAALSSSSAKAARSDKEGGK